MVSTQGFIVRLLHLGSETCATFIKVKTTFVSTTILDLNRAHGHLWDAQKALNTTLLSLIYSNCYKCYFLFYNFFKSYVL